MLSSWKRHKIVIRPLLPLPNNLPIMRQNKRIISLLCLGLFWCTQSLSLGELDQLYSFKNITAVVVNTHDEPVHGEHVESEIVKNISKQMRFDWHFQAHHFLKGHFQQQETVALGAPGDEKIEGLQALLSDLVKMGVDALVLAELRLKDQQYQLFFILMIPDSGEIIQSNIVPVQDRLTLDSFALAARQGLQTLLKAIPFDATIISREGYRVVIDSGYPRMRVGMNLPVYTMEHKMGEIVFVETGTVLVTQAERNLSFGKIVVEKKPREVMVGNKFRIHRPQMYSSRINIGYPGKKRVLSSVETLPPIQKGNLGNMSFSLGGSFVTHSITSADLTQSKSGSVFYPGGDLKSELWLTKRIFFDVGFQFSAAVLDTSGGGISENLNSSLSSFHGQLGYRLNVSGQPLGPTVFGKLGLAAHRFIIDQAVDPMFFGNATYSGLSLGAGADLPITHKLGFGIEINTLLFPSLNEGPQTSGSDTTHVSGFDLAIRSYYNLTSDLDVEAGLVFKSFNAQFTGTGARTTSLSSSSRSSKAVVLGMSYYF